MKRVAIPIVKNQLSEHFGACNYYEIFEIVGNEIINKRHEIPQDFNILELPEWLQKQGVTDVVSYKVNRKIISLFAANKVNLFVGIPIHSPEKLMEDYLKGTLESDKKIIELIEMDNKNI